MVALSFTVFSAKAAMAQQSLLDRSDPNAPKLQNIQLDYDNPNLIVKSGAWRSFGCQWVRYDDDDRLVFHVKPNSGLFQKIKIEVGSDQPYFIKAKIISSDGHRKKFNIASNKSFPGQGVEVKFSYIPQEIKRIILRYDARMRMGDRTKICVLGQKLSPASQLQSDDEESVENDRRPEQGRDVWKGLGCVKLGKRFNDDYIRIKAGQDRLEAIRFKVSRAPAVIENLEITYQNGKKQTFRVARNGRENKPSKVFSLEGQSKLSAIDIRARSRSLFQTSKICFEGLVSSKESGLTDQDDDGYRNEDRFEKKEPDFAPSERRFSENKRQDKSINPDVDPKEGSDLNDYIDSTKKQRESARKQAEQKRLEQQQNADAKRADVEAQAQKEAMKSAQRRAEAEAKKLEDQAQKDQARNGNKEKAIIAPSTAEKEAAKRHADAVAKEKLRAERLAQKLAEERAKIQAEQEAKRRAEQQAQEQEKREKELENLSKEEAEAKRLSDQAEQKRLEALREAQQLEAREKAEAAEEARVAAQAKAQEEQNRLAAEQKEKALIEAQRLAAIKKKADERLALKNRIHSKKADFPKLKVSPNRTGWISYGCQAFGTDIEELYIPVGRMQGTFTKIRVKALKNSLTLKKMIVVYGNGRQEPLIRYSSRVRMGEYTSEYKLSHKRRFISEVKLKAKARDYQNKEKVLVCLEAYR